MRAWPRDSDLRFAPACLSVCRKRPLGRCTCAVLPRARRPRGDGRCTRGWIPYVLTFHGGGHSARWRNRDPNRAAVDAAATDQTRRAARGYGRVGDRGVQRIAASPSRPVLLIPNGSTLPDVTAPTPPDGHLFVSIGRAERYKGHQHVIRAMPHVLSELPDARLWIAGEGPYERALWRQIEALGLRDRVEIYADRDRERYAARLAGASAALLCSDFETHPMGALEAVGLGVPLLVADNRGLTDLARQGIAHAVEDVRRPEILARQMLAAAATPHHADLSKIPTWDRCADLHRQLYDEVAVASRGGSSPAGVKCASSG